MDPDPNVDAPDADNNDANIFADIPDENLGGNPDRNPTVQPVLNPGLAPSVQFYTSILGFSLDAVNARAYEQQLDDPSNFLDLTNKDIDSICQAIRIPGGAGYGTEVALISTARSKLTAFYVKINQRMSHPQAEFDKITKHHLDLVKEQHKIELEYLQTKDNPDPKTMTLDLMTAPACFKKVEVILGSMHDLQESYCSM